jgi:predicted O-methyltransferase YrrM
MKTLLHLIGCLAGVEAPHTQVTDAELQILLKYSRRAHTICEIGCFEARTSVALAANAPESQVYSVDPFIDGRLGICYGEWIARLARRRAAARNLVFLKGFSDEVAPTFRQPIDFLFIDADHAYDAIKRDWENWVPKVVNGGMVALHDCKVAANSPKPLGTMRFYSEDLNRHDVREVISVDSLVVLEVRPSLAWHAGELGSGATLRVNPFGRVNE